MLVQLNGQVQWKWWVDPLSGGYVAECTPLKLTAAGETLSELDQDMHGALDDLFGYLLEEGELEQFLLEQGWTASLPITPELRERGPHFVITMNLQQVSAPKVPRSAMN